MGAGAVSAVSSANLIPMGRDAYTTGGRNSALTAKTADPMRGSQNDRSVTEHPAVLDTR
jgi:hypothetical protein